MEHEHSGHQHGMDGGMAMSFHSSSSVVVLFDFWTTSSTLAYAVTLLVLFAAAAAVELLRSQAKRLASPNAHAALATSAAAAEPWRAMELASASRRGASTPRQLRLVRTAVHTGTFLLAYLLMLAAMTFNAGVFLAIVAGSGVGFFLYRSEDEAEHGVLVGEENDACC